MNWGEDVEKDESMDISIGNEHTLYTGGCDGVDVCAEDVARSMGFQVHVKIGPSHRRSAFITPISYPELKMADPHIQKANIFLKRKIEGLPPFYMELLQRNWFVIKDATAVYAFGEFSDQQKSQVKGGTGWSVQMALDANKTVYVYDTKSLTWHQPFHYKWNEKGEWVKEFYFAPIGHSSWPGTELRMRSHPTLHKISAIVGSRVISAEIRNEIRELFHRTISLGKEVKALCTALDGCSLANNYDE